VTSGFHRYTAEQFLEEFVEPDDRVAVVEAAARNTAEHFGRQLAELRRKAGLTQREVAAAMGVGQQRVSAIEHGTDITTATLARYASAIGGRLYMGIRVGNESRELDVA
jgi:DNA-binding XRE family transcriptional regulator